MGWLSGLGKAFSSAANFLGGGGGGGLIGDLLQGGVSSLLSGGKTGQGMSGGPGAMTQLLSQGIPKLAGFDGGDGGAPAGVGSFLSSFGGDNDDLLSKVLSAGVPEGLKADASGGGAGDGGGWLSRLFGGGGGKDGGGGILSDVLIPGGVLGYQIWQGNQPIEGVETLRGLAGDAANNAATFSRGAAEAMQGNLPGGAQASIDQALRAAEARIRSVHAANGTSGSSMEAQELGDAQMRAVSQAFEIGQGLAQTGLQGASANNYLAANVYSQILNAELQRGEEMGDALAEFVAGLTQ